VRPSIALVLAAWLAVVVTLGASGAFVTPLGAPPLRIVLGVTLPLLIFLAAFWVSPSFRALLASADVPLLTALQALRFAGFTFIALHVYHVLPGMFAWPAGLGDMAIGITAPWMALALIRRPDLPPADRSSSGTCWESWIWLSP
jgi:hypothetical protein